MSATLYADIEREVRRKVADEIRQYAKDRLGELAPTPHPTPQDDITAALRVAAQRVERG